MRARSQPPDRPPSATTCVHAGEAKDPATGALEPPIHLATAFGFASAEQAAAAFRGEVDHAIYTRWRNPTIQQLEAKVVALEAAEETGYDACAAASGMAAIAGTVLSLCRQGDQIVAPRSMYGETSRLMRERLRPFGIETVFVEQADPGAYERAIGPRTRLLYVETPANPVLQLTDLRAVAELARACGLVTVADNTFATPYCQRPLSFGIDLVVHSMTKQLGGHGDAIGGIVVGERDRIAEIRQVALKSFGAIISPFTAWLVSRGMRTLTLRARQACTTALALARMLEQHPAVERVYYPGLESHPQHALARSQMSAFGAVVAFEVRGGREAGRRVLDGVRLISHAVSVGDARSLITHPASTTHAAMPPEVRAAAGLADGLLRISCGIEETEDVLADARRALDAV